MGLNPAFDSMSISAPFSISKLTTSDLDRWWFDLGAPQCNAAERHGEGFLPDYFAD
jgi:hypothetical protein